VCSVRTLVVAAGLGDLHVVPLEVAWILVGRILIVEVDCKRDALRHALNRKP
jgi:hypothetical protein